MDAMCLVFFFQHIFFGIRSLCVSHFTCGSSRAGLGKTSSLRDVDWKYAPAPQRQSLCSKMAHLVGLAHLGGDGYFVSSNISEHKCQKEWVVSWI